MSNTWYVDGAQVGGNGTDPASAYASVLSIAWADGDKAWVRRTHNESLAPAVNVGLVNSALAFSRWSHLIGWPDPTGEFYDIRPAAGVSAGWDADEPGTLPYSLFGYKFPMLTCSVNNATGGVGFFGHVANFYLNQRPGNTHFMWRNVRSYTYYSRMSNIMPVTSTDMYGGATTMQDDLLGPYGKVILITSFSSTTVANFQGHVSVEHLVVGSLTASLGGLFATTSAFVQVKLLENYSNSVGYLCNPGNDFSTEFIAAPAYIERCVGIQPYSGFSKISGTALGTEMGVGDYFGAGPRRDGNGRPNWRVGSSTEATFSGDIAGIMFVNSVAVGAHFRSGELRFRHQIKSYFDVTSGAGITINVPIYVDSTAVYSPAGGMLEAHLLARGTRSRYATNSSVIAGNAAAWVGSYCVGGSAYIFSAVFTPTETNTQVPFIVNVGPITQASSGAQAVMYALFGKPYKTP